MKKETRAKGFRGELKAFQAEVSIDTTVKFSREELYERVWERTLPQFKNR